MPANKKPARKPAAKPQAKKPALTGAVLIAAQKKAEKGKGVALPFVFGAITAAIVAAIMVFLFQDGLPVTDRCHCSWERVIITCVLVFAACVLQVFSYLSYREKCRQDALATSPKVHEEFEKKKPFRVFGVSIIIAVISAVVIFVAVPLLQDQNGNVLWFFTRGMGIVIVLLTLLMSALGGIMDKLVFNNHVK